MNVKNDLAPTIRLQPSPSSLGPDRRDPSTIQLLVIGTADDWARRVTLMTRTAIDELIESNPGLTTRFVDLEHLKETLDSGEFDSLVDAAKARHSNFDNESVATRRQYVTEEFCLKYSMANTLTGTRAGLPLTLFQDKTQAGAEIARFTGAMDAVLITKVASRVFDGASGPLNEIAPAEPPPVERFHDKFERDAK